MFRMPFSQRRLPLNGTPPVRRMKMYSAASGYVYHYFYEGYRATRHGAESGVEYVFSVSADRKQWNPASVMLSDAALRAWEESHQPELSATERYAVAKIALFQAFDERETPAQLHGEILVRAADLEAIAETLDL